jgi:hypothetical protein
MGRASGGGDELPGWSQLTSPGPKCPAHERLGEARSEGVYRQLDQELRVDLTVHAPQPLRGHAQGAVELLSPFPAHTGRRASVQRGGCRFGSIPWIRPVISPGEQAKDDSTAKERARSIILENDPPTYSVLTARTPASFSGLATRRTVRTILSETSRTSAETGSSPVVSTTPGSPLTWAKCTRNSPDGSDGLQETGRPLLGRDGEQEPGYLHLLDATTGITTGHGRHA